MKRLFFIIGIAMVSCCSPKRTTDASMNNVSAKSDKTGPAEPGESLPACINKMIRQFKSEDITNPPRSIYRYTYKGKTVYYVPAICCDFFSDLYDDRCNLIAHPDGGFTGRGDGKVPDFIDTRTNEKLVWKDDRK